MSNKLMLSVVLVNIVASVFVSVSLEYNRIGDVARNLTTVVDTALDNAVDSTMMAEEFFSDDLNNEMISVADCNFDRLSYIKDGNWVRGNAYVVAMYYDENGELPTEFEYGTYLNGLQTAGRTTPAVYKWMFGDEGADYLAWSPKPSGTSSMDSYIGNSRKPSAEFKAFYDAIGKEIKSTEFVKVRQPDDTWVIEEREVPVLCNMGLILDESSDNINFDPSKPEPDFTSDNYTTSIHFGRLISGTERYSQYYLTPYSLGVTYLQPQLLKVNTLVNMQNLIRSVRFRVSPTNDETTLDIDGNIINLDASGDIQTAFLNYSNTGGINDYSHIVDGSSEIYNDGIVEYDLSTLQLEINYAVVDFYDDANAELVAKVLGAIPGDTNLTNKVALLRNSDTTSEKNGNRIVAEVTAKVKIHVPYKSVFLQWAINRRLGSSIAVDEHYGIRGISDDGLTVSADGDLYYQYTTYATISR